MADSYTDFLNLTKPEIAGSRDAWGDKWNANADAISLWAKGVDAYAKDSLGLTRVQKDAQGATVPWDVVGAINFAGDLKFAKGFTVPKPAKGFFGGATVQDTDANFEIVTSAANSFRVVNNQYNAELFRVVPDGLYFGGDKRVWHTGNLTPANYLDRTSTAQQITAADIQISKAIPRYVLNNPNVRQWALTVEPDTALSFWDYTASARRLYIGVDGSVWTSQFGDLNSRIETRATALADDRLNSAKAYTNSYAVAKTGDISSGDQEIRKGYPSLFLHYPGVRRASWQVRENGFLYWIDQGGSAFFYIGSSGELWCSQFGDVNTRIETRAQAFADDRLNTATARINNKTCRWVFVGDSVIGDQPGNQMFEGYGGSAITGYMPNGSTGYARAFRFRQLQMSDSNGNYYAIGYT